LGVREHICSGKLGGVDVGGMNVDDALGPFIATVVLLVESVLVVGEK